MGADAQYQDLAVRTGRLLAERGITLVYGGGSIGLMGTVARAALNAGGRVVGVIPQFLADREVALKECSELVIVPSMHVRKQVMLDRSDACVALPGGIGTLDELIEAMTWRELFLHDKPLWLLDEDGYWAPFNTMFDHIHARGFASDRVRGLVQQLDGLEAFAQALDLGLPT
jgi:uncharacterized protein (TIGR00730 family)